MARRSAGHPGDVFSIVQGFVEIIPLDVARLDKIDLPFALVFLQTRFAKEGGFDALKDFEIDEATHAVLLREARDQPPLGARKRVV